MSPRSPPGSNQESQESSANLSESGGVSKRQSCQKSRMSLRNYLRHLPPEEGEGILSAVLEELDVHQPLKRPPSQAGKSEEKNEPMIIETFNLETMIESSLSLIDACRSNNFDKVHYLFVEDKENGRPCVNVNFKDEFGMTPILYAIKFKNLKLVKFLLERKASVCGFAGLIRACLNDSVEILRLLIQHIGFEDDGFDINSYRNLLRTGLADIIGEIDLRKSLLYNVVRRKNLKNYKEIIEAIMMYLINRYDQRDTEKNYYEIIYRIYRDDINGVRGILKHYYEERKKRRCRLSRDRNEIRCKFRQEKMKFRYKMSEETPLYYAVFFEKYEIIDVLLNHRISTVNEHDLCVNNVKKGLLHCAVEQNNLKMAKFLTEKGADIHLKAGAFQVENNISSLYLAMSLKNLEMVKLFLGIGPLNCEDKEFKKKALGKGKSRNLFRSLMQYQMDVTLINFIREIKSRPCPGECNSFKVAGDYF